MKSTRSHASSSTAAAREGAVLPRPPSAIASLAHRASRRWLPLNGEKLCAEAQRRTGLQDFGDPPLQPGLSILLESLEQEAQLHPLGRLLMRIHLRGLLETRLRLVEAWKSKQDALEAHAIEKPVFVVGTPRSGSTFLHELLAEDPGNRAPRVWEVMFPVAVPGGGEPDRKRRIRKAETCLWWFRRLAPEADAVYPMRAGTPHECVAIHSYTFLSEEFRLHLQNPRLRGFSKISRPRSGLPLGEAVPPAPRFGLPRPALGFEVSRPCLRIGVAVRGVPRRADCPHPPQSLGGVEVFGASHARVARTVRPARRPRGNAGARSDDASRAHGALPPISGSPSRAGAPLRGCKLSRAGCRSNSRCAPDLRATRYAYYGGGSRSDAALGREPLAV